MITLSIDGYERLSEILKAMEFSARRAVLDPTRAGDHARESITHIYQLRQTMVEVISLGPEEVPQEASETDTGPEIA